MAYDAMRPSARPTAYLDGLRGLAALCVCLRHFLIPWEPEIDAGFLQVPTATSFLRLPPFRLVYAGPYVPLFLLVSGIVMSMRPVQYMKSQQSSAFQKNLNSAVFRRAIRLLAPPIVSTWMVAMAAYFGAFSFDHSILPGHVAPFPQRKVRLSDQMYDWASFVFREMANPWTWRSPETGRYGPHLWTIPLQLRCSLAMFVVLVGISRANQRARRVVIGGLIIWTCSWGRWDMALYLMGLLAVDFELFEVNTSLCLPSFQPSTWPNTMKNGSFNLPWLSVLIIGLYISSFPRSRTGTHTLGYEFLYLLTPNYRHWHACGAILLVWCIAKSEGLQHLMASPGPLHLGRISFALYVVHEPIMHIFAYRMVDMSWRLTGTSTPLQHVSGLAIALAMTLPVLIASAHFFTRFVERPCTTLLMWVEQKSRTD